MKSAKCKVLRQGDVLLVSVGKLPKGAEIQKFEHNKIVLALGEATGHHHRIEDVVTEGLESARIFSFGAERFLQVMKTVALKHEEHSEVGITPGNYQVVIQTEYTPEEIRRVID